MMRLRRLLACIGLIALSACDDATLEPLPLDIVLESSRTTALPGDTVSFLVSAQGGSLFGIMMDFGDGTGDQLATAGARTARVTFRHAYSSAGLYETSATVSDAMAGDKRVSLTIRIQ